MGPGSVAYFADGRSRLTEDASGTWGTWVDAPTSVSFTLQTAATVDFAFTGRVMATATGTATATMQDCDVRVVVVGEPFGLSEGGSTLVRPGTQNAPAARILNVAAMARVTVPAGVHVAKLQLDNASINMGTGTCTLYPSQLLVTVR